MDISSWSIAGYSVLLAIVAFAAWIANAYWMALKRQYGLDGLDVAELKQPEYTLPEAPHDYTAKELIEYDGEDGKAILIAVKGKVYDITSHPSGRNFYGKGCGYSVFAGHDASRALATMDFDDVDKSIEGLGATELSTLDEWEAKYDMKYKVVGKLISS